MTRHKRWQLIAILIGLACSSAPALAGKYNKVLSIGDAAPAWEQLIGTDGKQHSLTDLAGKPLVVVVFTCNSCPYAVDYEDRIIELVNEFGSQVAVVAINVNRQEEDRLEAMTERARTKKFNFPYLFDESQQIAQRYGATRTPEFFVLNQQRKVIYMGSMDDSPDGTKIQHRHVAAAIQAELAGQAPETTETIAIGCLIRYARPRR